MQISIIVPIFHGKRYIDNIVLQAEENARNIDDKIELLLVNDDPSEPINESWFSDSISIQAINTEINRGIHGARVRGLERAKGEFILLLDQDDQITSDYLKKQLTAMGNADAVVCKALQDHKEFYHQDRMLDECINKNYMVQNGNFIISPGQVLLRKASIPIFWKENILHSNGADDWFLWICMLCAGKKFVCNRETLFEHMVHGENASANGTSMLNSMHEVYEKLKKNTDCAEKDLQGIVNVIQKHEKNYLDERDKFLELYFMLDSWMDAWEQDKSVADYIRNHGHNKVAIYGKGRVGLRLARELQVKGIEVSCFIDQNANILAEGIRTVLPEEVKDILEPIIVTLAKNQTAEVKRLLRDNGAGQVYSLSDIIEALKYAD